MSSAAVSAVSNLSNNNLEARRMANFKPSAWGDKFLHYTPDTKGIEAQEEVAKEFKEDIHKELISSKNKPLIEQLCLIDSIERLGVAYHFEQEIEDALKHIHETTDPSSDDLFLTSLCFRLLRQHGFKVSSDVFKGFVNAEGGLNEAVASDAQGILSLYEACHIRIHGEDILDELLIFTTSKLKSMEDDDQLSETVLKEQVSRALKKALHKRTNYVASVPHYMQVYEKDPTHNKTLLPFAKINFNLLQSCYKKELSDLTRWWKRVDLTAKLPIRDRVVECYFWAVGVHHEPQYSIARKIMTISSQIMTSVDDLYDAYGTIEELQIFTDAVQRWDKSGLDQLKQLPEVYRWFYQTFLLDAYEEMESDLAPLGRSFYVNYAKEEMKALCRTYLIEVSWRKKNYIPTFDEYSEIVVRNSGFVAQILFTFLHTDIATHEAFKWLSSLPKPVEAVCLLLRILNDIASPELDKTRGHSPFIIASYMRQYDVSYEQACKVLSEKTHQLWKDLNEAMILPTEVPMPMLKCMLNLARLIDYTYDGGEDAYTSVHKGMVEDIMDLCMNLIPI